MAGEVLDTPDVEQEEGQEDSRKEREKELNASRTGKGMRIRLGKTRGRNPQEIQFEAFDESQPETLPETVAEFLQLSGVEGTDQKTIVSLLVKGKNAVNYSAASDPILAFLNPAWSDERKQAFRGAVRNMTAEADCSVEGAVGIVKPVFEKAHAKEQATAPKA